MLAASKNDHDGWDIISNLREDNPEDWKPGDPIRYAANGTARFAHPHHYPPGYTSKNQISYPEAHFTDYNQAHREIQQWLRDQIDLLKAS